MADGMMEARRPRWLPWTGRRPELSSEGLALLASAYFAVTANGAFWRAASAAGDLSGPTGWLTAASLFVAIFAVHAALLCLLLTRWTAKPVLTMLLLTTAAASYFASAYAVHLDPGMVRNVLGTDSRESAELLTPALIGMMLAYGLLPAALLWTVRIRRTSWWRALIQRVLTVVALTALAVVALLVAFQDVSSLMRNHKPLRYLIAPGNYLSSLGRVLLGDMGEPKGPRQVVAADARLAGHTPTTKPHLLVIVIGETVRAQNWGLNGYARQTTPQLAKRDVINFRDVTACGSNTEVSVPCMFSVIGRRGYDRSLIRQSESLLHVLERAGIKTLWRDNQTGCKGVCDGLAFESYRQLRNNPLCDDRTCRDVIMLEGLHEAIDTNPGDVVVVLHQLGNHGPSYFRRYPPALRVYRPDCTSPDLGACTQQEIVNAYDNAILATDDFLARTVDLLAQDANHDTALVYVSDHGESLGERNLYLHGLPYALAPETQVKVPMVMWLSPGMAADRGVDARCLKQQATQPVSHDYLFHSVLGLLQVSTREYDPAFDIFAPCTVRTAAAQIVNDDFNAVAAP
ncbi:phosphoethanolamine transferase [Marilutibacter spongiae]|uniref:Phosphoethanolamine--lipid A transferase n=1 Tax=Marilutibacter spongiae TaxID=2025720 RepID=A0A7W3Y4S7_9GAMM|nr:phosphoethanolamine--lipid A transferase [Lysobacter spongiae]MBB1059250.1 phosphoethanolamine--lipid A transferase [Lysobacter spongiae]